ncbi:MAG: hypothetical protein ACI4CS_06485 [Candidatus Weimeria sp.]
MRIEMLISRFAEPDLLSLHQAGYSLPRMTRDVLISLSHGKPIHIMLGDEDFPLDTDVTKVRVAVIVDDAATVELLKSVRPKFRSAFCKAALREAFIHQNLSAFFEDTAQIKSLMYEPLSGDVSVTDYRRKPGVIHAPFTGTERRGVVRHRHPSRRVTIPNNSFAAEQGTAVEKTGTKTEPALQDRQGIVRTEPDTSPVREPVTSPVIPPAPEPVPSPATYETEPVPAAAESHVPVHQPEKKPLSTADNDDDDEGIIYLDDDSGEAMSEEDLLDAFDKL